MTALGRLAPEYRQLIKDGASFEDVMAKLGKTTGGAATDAANTAAGQFKRMKLALDETKESVGAALLPAIEAILPYLTKFATWASENPKVFLGIAGAIAGISAAIIALNFALAANPITLIAIGIAALGAALTAAYHLASLILPAYPVVALKLKYRIFRCWLTAALSQAQRLP
jgi:phage shock protein PspC (stress-responsive transcriptional regulator)